MQDKRQHHRITLDATVVCRRGNDDEFTCRAQDISLGGMFLRAEEEVQFGEKLDITLSLPGHSKPLALPAVVRWVRADGFGVQFGLLGARETHAITRFSVSRS